MKGLGIMKKTNKKGFTLIEVVLVLAIGGLIFLLAFIAFRNASVNRRDTQRRNDVNRIVSEIANYAGDHNGSIPGAASAGAAGSGGQGSNFNQFIVDYLGGSNFKDPQAKTYNIVQTSLSSTNDIMYTTGAYCTGSTGTPGSRDYKIEMKLEKGTVCRDTSGS
jgi:prepilin-type N-terminal cleavage/methylation domain-containing protein